MGASRKAGRGKIPRLAKRNGNGFVQKYGVRSDLLDKYLDFRKTVGEHSDLSPAKKLKSFEWWDILKIVRTYFAACGGEEGVSKNAASPRR